MLKMVLSAIMIIATMATAQTSEIWKGEIDTDWYDESKTEFTITTAEQLAGLAKLVNEGNSFEEKTITLGANIMLNDTTDWRDWNGGETTMDGDSWITLPGTNFPTNEWTAIGGENIDNYFRGTFDGANFIVGGVYINNLHTTLGHGLFGNIGNGGEIKNLGVISSFVNGLRAGGLAGSNFGGTITNCYATGNIEGNDVIGGLVGLNSQQGIINNSYATGNVESRFSAGGLVGWNTDNSAITSSYASGNVKSSGDVGGLVGSNQTNSTISKSYATGNVDGADNSIAVGGLVGNSSGTINNCYATGNVKGGMYSNTGGLVGFGGTINNSYSIGKVEGDDRFVSGLTNSIGGTIVNNSYFDREASGQNRGAGTARTTAQMKQRETFAGWDFENIWGISSNINNGYPHLLGFGTEFVDVVWTNTTLEWHGEAQAPTATATLADGTILPLTITGHRTEIGNNYVATAALTNLIDNVSLRNRTTNFSIVRRTIEVRWENTGPFVFNKMPQAPRATITTGYESLDTLVLTVFNRHRDVGRYTAADQSHASAEIANQNFAPNITLTNRTIEYEIIRRPLNVVMRDRNNNIRDTIVADTVIRISGDLFDYIESIIDYDNFATDTIRNETDDKSVLRGKPKIGIQNDDSQRSLRNNDVILDRNINLSIGERFLVTVITEDITADNYTILERKIAITIAERFVTITTDIRDDDPTAISNIKKSDSRYGIKFAINPVSDKAEIGVILPNNERATETKIAIYDMTGNVVFSTTARDNVSWDLRNTAAGRFVANGTYLVIAEAKDRNGKLHVYSARLGVKR